MALSAVGEVYSPVLQAFVILGTVMQSHRVVVHRVFEVSALVVPASDGRERGSR